MLEHPVETDARFTPAKPRSPRSGLVLPAYAHSLPGARPERWEPLEHHLDEVARLAADFAGAFGAREWGAALGRWHDLGKYSQAFQHYLLSTSDPDAGEERVAGRVDHSTYGAQHAAKVVGKHAGRILAFCIAGHHAGLADATSDDEMTRRRTLEARLAAGPPRVPTVQLPSPNESWAPQLKLPFTLSPEQRGFQVAFYTRMLFSCLIDADRIATEAFCNPAESVARSARKSTLDELRLQLTAYLQQKEGGAPSTAVNRLRAQVHKDCLTAAALPLGFFSLNVPTGGGKTLSSLAFALSHASAHGLRRVVMAIPFTSIIEQTADVYRDALVDLAEAGLVEHHSSIAPTKDTRRNQLATENWDAPLVVTTNVQLYESLFAAATTPCRKLHRLARSVIILDEAQTLPVEVLAPTLLALKELVEHYGCTVVLCTATQPALNKRDGFPIGIENVREIVKDVPALYQSLKRVRIAQLGRLTDDELATRLGDEPAALCIVNSRPQAAAVYGALVRVRQDACFHLSTFMCAQHRRHTLKEIRARLANRERCCVVSTSLIEAGVDVDFPVVYRAPAGFDSIAQAAGRCNREGRLDHGIVYLFDAETPPPIGFLRNSAATARELSPRFADPLEPDAVSAYFELFYWSQNHRWDHKSVLAALTDDLREERLLLKFETAASRYRIIRDDQAHVLVPYDATARKVRDGLRQGEPVTYQLMRRAQRYVVGVYRHDLASLVRRGAVEEHEESGLFLLVNDSAYSRERGLAFDGIGTDADLLIA